MVIIGIVSRPNISEQGRCNTMVLDDMRKAVIEFGAVPISILPPQNIDYFDKKLNEIPPLTNKDKQILEEQIKLCSGVIMPGGTVMHEYDKYVCEYCNRNNIPLFGICMGMQIMCNYNNDNKNIKIEDGIDRSEMINHNLTIDKDSILYNIIGKEEIEVNSFHRYKVSNSGSYKVSARNNDVIEAVEKEGKFNIGLQWHPERNIEDENSKKLFKEFINSIDNNK